MAFSKIVLTGGAGFIGCNLVRHALAQPGVDRLVIVDKLTYAGSLLSLDGPLKAGRDPQFGGGNPRGPQH